MRHLKIYEKWSSSVTDDNININYGDKQPELSDLVKFTKEYIEENFDDIYNIRVDILSISFRKNKNVDYESIELKQKKDNIYMLYEIYFKNRVNEYDNIDITEEEYNYLRDYFYKTSIIFKKKQQKNKIDNIVSKIDPTQRAAKKYNL
jgi:hypothetical protein